VGKSLIDWNVASTDPLKGSKRVVGTLLYLDVAVHRRNSEEFEPWVKRRKHDCNGIIGSSIDV
jgi:hypothetical protein